MVIVDSSVLIDFLAAQANRQSLWLKNESESRRIGITDLALCEVLQGLRSDDQEARTLRILARFEILETGSMSLAMSSARNYRALRLFGVTVRNTVDCLTATFCIQNQHTLLHRDRDFDGFEEHLGLQVFHPPISRLH